MHIYYVFLEELHQDIIEAHGQYRPYSSTCTVPRKRRLQLKGFHPLSGTPVLIMPANHAVLH